MASNKVQVVFEALVGNFKTNVNTAARSLLTVGTNGEKASNKVSKGFRNSTSAVDSLNSKLRATETAIKTFISAYAGKKVLDFTIGSAFDLETYLIQYKVLLGSLDAAKERMNEIQEFSNITPFETPELIKSDKILEGFGIRSSKMLETIGNVSAALENPKEKLVEISTYIGRISKGQTGESLARFEELGITSRADLQKNYGLEFDKGGAYKGNTNDLMYALMDSFKKYDGMMEQLSQTGSGKLSTLSEKFKQFGRDIGNNALNEAKGAIDDLIKLLDELAANGTLDSLASSLGTILSAIINLLREILSHADQIIEKIAIVAQAFSDNMPQIIALITSATIAFLVFKGAMAITSIINGLLSMVQAFKKLNEVIKITTLLQKTLNAVMTKNPVGLILMVAAPLIIALLDKLLGKTVNAADKISDICDEIEDTSQSLDEMTANEYIKQKEKLEVDNAIVYDDFKFDIKDIKTPEKERTIDDDISDIDKNYNVKINYYKSGKDLASANDDKSTEKKYTNLIIDTLKAQANDLLGLSGRVSGDNKLKVDTARNKLLQEIANLTNNINGAVQKMTGSFNLPSNLTALTEYQDIINNSNSVINKKLITTNDIKMYITVEGMNEESGAKVQSQANNFINGLLGKDSRVEEYISDVRR